MKVEKRWFALLLVVAGPVQPGAVVAAAEAPGAEYAFRWRPADGGPKDGKAALTLLGEAPQQSDKVLVQYYSVTPPADAPAGFTSILRQRSKPGGGKAEVTWKYRGEQGFPEGDWRCPLKGNAKLKREVDVAVLPGGEANKAYSISCTVKGAVADVVPAELAPQVKGCSNRVHRYDGASVQVEAWQLASGLVLEVSRKAADDATQLEDFRHTVVDKLAAVGAKAMGGSKSLLGGECGGT